MKNFTLDYGQTARNCPDGTTRVSGRCVVTGKDHHIVVDSQGLFEWRMNGVLIQNALPEASADDREFLISGISPEGWEAIFGR